MGSECPQEGESRAFYQDQPSPLGIGAESEEGSQQKICYRVGHEPSGLDRTEDQRDGEDLRLTYMLSWPVS